MTTAAATTLGGGWEVAVDSASEKGAPVAERAPQ